MTLKRKSLSSKNGKASSVHLLLFMLVMCNRIFEPPSRAEYDMEDARMPSLIREIDEIVVKSFQSKK